MCLAVSCHMILWIIECSRKHRFTWDHIYSSPSNVGFFMPPILIVAHSVCRSLGKVSTLPTCRPRVPTTALPIRTTLWACCFCVRWVRRVHRAPGRKEFSTHSDLLRASNTGAKDKRFAWEGIDLMGFSLHIKEKLYLIAKFIATVMAYYDSDLDFINILMYLHCPKWGCLLSCNCRLLWVTATSCWTPTTKPTNCLMENTAPRAWARPDPTPGTAPPCESSDAPVALQRCHSPFEPDLVHENVQLEGSGFALKAAAVRQGSETAE